MGTIMKNTFVNFEGQVCLVTGENLVVDGGNTIQEYKGPSELYY